MGVTGVAPNVTIMPVKVLGSTGSGYMSDVAAGITYAADHDAKIISMSLPNSAIDDATHYAFFVVFLWQQREMMVFL